MENPARHGFPYLAGALLLAGCKSEPARLDTLAISRLRPGHTRIEDVQALLGSPVSVKDWPFKNSECTTTANWGPQYSDWTFFLRSDGTVIQFSPQSYAWHIVVVPVPGLNSAKPFEPPYHPPKAVPPECAQLFIPGLTTQSEIVAAWGACSSAAALPEGRFEMRWGSHEDSWYLEFDADGLLRTTPRHDTLHYGR